MISKHASELFLSYFLSLAKKLGFKSFRLKRTFCGKSRQVLIWVVKVDFNFKDDWVKPITLRCSRRWSLAHLKERLKIMRKEASTRNSQLWVRGTNTVRTVSVMQDRNVLFTVWKLEKIALALFETLLSQKRWHLWVVKALALLFAVVLVSPPAISNVHRFQNLINLIL